MTARFDKFDWAMLVGAALLTLGVCLPVVSIPIVGSMSYLHGGKGDGVIVLLLAVLICGLVFCRLRLVGGAAGIAVAAIVLHTFVGLLQAINKVGETELAADNPFAGFANLLADSVGLGFGWIPMLLGVTLVIGGAFVPLFQPTRSFGDATAPATEFDPDAIVKKYLDDHPPALRNAAPTFESSHHPTLQNHHAFGRREGHR